MPTPRWGLTTVAVNGKIYAIGGTADASRTPLRVVEEYDPSQDSWAGKAELVQARYIPYSSVANGRIYVFAGTQTFPTPLDSVEEYTPDGWKPQSVSSQGKLATTWSQLKLSR